jgi:hypothetical protein
MTPTRSGPEGPLQTALQESTTAAATRAAEGQRIFGPIAAFLDQHRSQTSGLPPHLQGALASLSDDLAAVAQRHFSAFISGMGLENPKPPSLPAAVRLTPPGLAQSTYATVASSAAPAKPSSSAKLAKRAPPKQQAPDNRLFVRLPMNHSARGLQAYAIYSSLRAVLGPDGPLLKEVQPTNSGFALCPSANSVSALEAQKEKISAFFGTCQVEKGSRWVSYRVTNVPRSIGRLSHDNKYALVPVDSEAVAQAVTDEIGLSPISVTQTSYSATNDHLPYSSWFVNFPEGTTTPIPRHLRLFGVTTTTRPLAQKTTVVQCNRCWMWHNSRSCARPPRCRLCGSTEHSEENHANRCSAPSPHQCPPRCHHCHGPHPADHPECLLRPSKATASYTKTQKSEIRKSCSAALAQARTENGCCSEPPAVTPEVTPEYMAVDTQGAPPPSEGSPPPHPPISSPFRPTTPPPPSPPREAPSTNRAVRFADRPTQPANRFNALLNERL